MPDAKSPTTRMATVTPVTFARRLIPRHHRVRASVFAWRSRGASYAVLPDFSM